MNNPTRIAQYQLRHCVALVKRKAALEGHVNSKQVETPSRTTVATQQSL
jgi:hypothetical protein